MQCQYLLIRTPVALLGSPSRHTTRAKASCGANTGERCQHQHERRHNNTSCGSQSKTAITTYPPHDERKRTQTKSVCKRIATRYRGDIATISYLINQDLCAPPHFTTKTRVPMACGDISWFCVGGRGRGATAPRGRGGGVVRRSRAVPVGRAPRGAPLRCHIASAVRHPHACKRAHVVMRSEDQRCVLISHLRCSIGTVESR